MSPPAASQNLGETRLNLCAGIHTSKTLAAASSGYLRPAFLLVEPEIVVRADEPTHVPSDPTGGLVDHGRMGARADPERTHELVAFVDEVSDMLTAEYTRIRSRVLEDRGTAGDEAELNWRGAFEDWLPSELTVVTKGRILGHDGEASPQLDVIVLRPGYPPFLREKKTYLAGEFSPLSRAS